MENGVTRKPYTMRHYPYLKRKSTQLLYTHERIELVINSTRVSYKVFADRLLQIVLGHGRSRQPVGDKSAVTLRKVTIWLKHSIPKYGIRFTTPV